MNLKDPNTSFNEARKIVITISFREDESRDNADMTIKVDTKLAAAVPFKSRVAFGVDRRSGEVISQEYGTSGGNMTSDDPEEEEPGTIKKFRKEA